MLDEIQFPRLTYLLRCYFYQACTEIFEGDDEQALRPFFDETRGVLVDTADEMTRFIDARFTNAEIGQYCDGLNAGSLPEPEDFAAFLAGLQVAMLEAAARKERGG